jgi:hypothetical protein
MTDAQVDAPIEISPSYSPPRTDDKNRTTTSKNPKGLACHPVKTTIRTRPAIAKLIERLKEKLLRGAYQTKALPYVKTNRPQTKGKIQLPQIRQLAT